MTGLEMRQLRYFVAVAEELNFGRAAARAGITQPSLTLQMQALEERVGGALLVRRPGVALTEAGRELLVWARRMIADADAGLAATRRVLRGETGTLTLGAVASTLLVPRIARGIRKFRSRFPDVELRLLEMTTTAQIEMLGSGTIDAALVRQPPNLPDLNYETVMRERLLVALPAGHRLLACAEITPSQLRGESFVSFSRQVNTVLHDHFLTVCRSGGELPVVVQEAAEFLTCISLVEAGFGIAIVPASLRRVRVPGVSYRRLQAPASRTDIVLCWRESPPSARVQALARAMATPAALGHRSRVSSAELRPDNLRAAP
jgi:DNA-binding transcriptional LysR family regulator